MPKIEVFHYGERNGKSEVLDYGFASEDINKALSIIGTLVEIKDLSPGAAVEFHGASRIQEIKIILPLKS